MASLAASISRPRSLLLRLPNPSAAAAALLRHAFSSSPDPPSPAPAAAPTSPADIAASTAAAESGEVTAATESGTAPTTAIESGGATAGPATTGPPPADGGGRRRHRTRAERLAAMPLHATIAHMMAGRAWTTRLQNSIRNLSPTFTTPLVLDVISHSFHPNHALTFFRWVEKTGFRHDPDTYTAIVTLLSRNKMLNHARCILLDDMPKRSVAPTELMFAALIDGYGRAGIPQEAVKIFKHLPELGIVQTSVSYDAFFKAILSNGRYMMAKRYYNAMVRDNVKPSVTTFNTLIWGFGLCRRMGAAERSLAAMKEAGLEPSIVTYNTLLNGWVRWKRTDKAKDVFYDMQEDGAVPNEVTYNLMIKAFVAEGDVVGALGWFDKMKKRGLQMTMQTYDALLPGLCLPSPGFEVEKRSHLVVTLLKEMIDKKIWPKDRSVFLNLITCLCELGDFDGALAVRKSMGKLRANVKSEHYAVLLEALCKGGKYDKAIKVVDDLLKNGTLVTPWSMGMAPSAFNPIIEYLCDNGFTKKAEVFFRQLMKNGVDDKVAFNNLISGHAKEGAPESAFEFLGIMTRLGVPSDAKAYELLVESFLKKGEPTDARTVLDNMMEQGHMPSASLFRSVMVALFDDGRVQTASRVMRSMIEKGVKENMDIAHKIVEALFTRGHIEEALGRINLMVMKDCIPDFDKLLVALIDNGKVMEANKLAEFALERDHDINFSNYDRMLDALNAKGKHMAAYSLLCQIKAKGGAVNTKGCDELVEKLKADGNTKQADILSRILAGKARVGTKRGNNAPMNA